jgi:hypothetical protein
VRDGARSRVSGLRRLRRPRHQIRALARQLPPSVVVFDVEADLQPQLAEVALEYPRLFAGRCAVFERVASSVDRQVQFAVNAHQFALPINQDGRVGTRFPPILQQIRGDHDVTMMFARLSGESFAHRSFERNRMPQDIARKLARNRHLRQHREVQAAPIFFLGLFRHLIHQPTQLRQPFFKSRIFSPKRLHRRTDNHFARRQSSRARHLDFRGRDCHVIEQSDC